MRAATPTLSFPRRFSRGYAVFDVLLIVAGIALLAALVVPVAKRFGRSANDRAKAHNAQVMNQQLETLFAAHVDTAAWRDGAAAIAALHAGFDVPPTPENPQAEHVQLKDNVNPAAYTFVPGTAKKAPLFIANIADDAQRP